MSKIKNPDIEFIIQKTSTNSWELWISDRNENPGWFKPFGDVFESREEAYTTGRDWLLLEIQNRDLEQQEQK